MGNNPHDVMTNAIETERRTRQNRSSPRLAGAAWEALDRSGFAIVEKDGPTPTNPRQQLADIRRLCESTTSKTPDGTWYVDIEDLYNVLDGLNTVQNPPT
ncbi:hypothetical protein PROPHIGD91-2_114 [Mycobacterium phage prophiGD91-2]|uniref:hypothetical protein n=1 Tax=Mycobacteroides abscessus TaxID=36809 RepID=UPI000928F010|nr:hypothetical protein [Mycobacteroides abscessus]QSM03967.1 hypothetical protein PROPHIGD91-2_114 [Mycobacterium phage prophiGD91-2]QSM90840.1 hypothetical protein I3U44_09420 [Mycobacteroides abscessus subsp. bolletii]SIJ00707.1 Uncharacterised protein [Mycobacteroides abscessus subsp. bolletii]SLD36253.1 Uncharacterised protein [Mycobacteroides abscessus subsp. bolletii]